MGAESGHMSKVMVKTREGYQPPIRATMAKFHESEVNTINIFFLCLLEIYLWLRMFLLSLMSNVC